MYFKDSISWALSHIVDSLFHISFYITYIFKTFFELYTIWKELWQLQPQDQHFQQPRTRKALIQVSPPLDKFLIEVREKLTVLPSIEQTSPIPEIPQECNSQVFETEQLFLHTPNMLIECIHVPLVICNDHAFTKFIQGEEGCLKFINQDLTFLNLSSIPSTFSNISNMDGASAKVREPSRIQLLTCIPQENTNTPPTQTKEPVLGFTLAEICQTQAEPKLTVQQLLEIKSCQEYVKTLLETLDCIYVNQPKRFLPLAKEAKKLAEEFRKEQVASQWVGIPYEKLLQESFVKQLNSLQSLDQLAPLKAAKEHLSKDIINILELPGKADNILFNQLYNLAEDCADRYCTKVIKTLTQLLKSSFHDRQLVLVNTAQALKFLESYVARQINDRLPNHFHDLQTPLQTEFSLLKKATLKILRICRKLSIYNKLTLPHSVIMSILFMPNWCSLIDRSKPIVYIPKPM